MAIESKLETVTRKKVDRTYRVECFCEAQTPVMSRRVVWGRAIATYDGNGDLESNESPAGSVERSFGQIANDVIAAGGIKATCAQIMALIAAAGDKYRDEDLKREAAEKEPPGE